jgi:hypothetical protein
MQLQHKGGGFVGDVTACERFKHESSFVSSVVVFDKTCTKEASNGGTRSASPLLSKWRPQVQLDEGGGGGGYCILLAGRICLSIFLRVGDTRTIIQCDGGMIGNGLALLSAEGSIAVGQKS